MLIVMKNDATAEQIKTVCAKIESLGFQPHSMPGAQRTAVCVTGNRGQVPEQHFLALPGVLEVIRVSKPYKLSSRETKHENTVFTVGKTQIGKDFLVIAGTCSVETEDSMFRHAEQLKNMGVNFFRAGAYKPRTSPYDFQGHAEKGLAILDKVKQKFDMSIVTEVLDCETLSAVAEVADIIQVGTRNMSNTSLLKALGKLQTPVLLKRGMSATLDELLLAAEYILVGGNHKVILCERGIRSFNTYTRNTLDIAAVPALQERSHLPVIVDPSHAAGITSLVKPLALAAVAAGAQGLIVEVHDDAANAYSDGQQALHPNEFRKLLERAQQILTVS